MKHYYCHSILFILLLHPKLAVSQTSTITVKKNWLNATEKWFSGNDTAYIKKSSNKYAIVLKNSNWLDIYNFKLDNKSTLELKSNLCYNLGLSVGYKSILFGYSVNLTDVFSAQSVGSKEMDLHINTNRFNLNLLYTTNKGLTNISYYKDLNGIQKINESFDGLNTKTFEADFYYFFNKYKYSNAAAYSNSYYKQQKMSAGSFILGLSYSKRDIFFDFSKLPQENQYVYLKEMNQLKIRYSSYCVNIGYGYNLVFSKRWLANLTYIPSVGINIYPENSLEKSENTHFSMNSKMKAALVYNMSQYFLGLSCHYYSNWYFADNYTLTNSLGIFNLSFGVRF